MILFRWIYREIISPEWSYLGYRYDALSLPVTAIGWAGSLLPVLWMPITLRRPSQALYWLLYLTVYIPSMLVPYYLDLQPVSDLVVISGYFLAGFAAIGMSFRIPLPPPIRQTIGRREFWIIFWFLYVVMTAIFLFAFGSSLRLVSFAERNEVRMAARLVEPGTVADYSRSWLALCLNPILMAVAWLRRRPTLFLIGAAGEILLYSSTAFRSWAITILYVPILYFALKGKSASFGLRMTVFTSSIFLLVPVLHVAESRFERDLSDDFVARIHVNSGFLTAEYAKFFSENPLTYGSQITGLNRLITYPYSIAIQYVIGDYLANNPELSANANIWADGIASFGPVGLLVISVVLAGIFFLLDFGCQHLDPAKTALIIGVHFVNLSNAALATSFVGGGLGFSIVLLMLMPRSVLELESTRVGRTRLHLSLPSDSVVSAAQRLS